MKMTLFNIHQKMKSMLIAVGLFLVMAASGYAQEDPIDVDTSPSELGNGEVPIDGGLSLLLAAGAIYGGRRLARKKNATK